MFSSASTPHSLTPGTEWKDPLVVDITRHVSLASSAPASIHLWHDYTGARCLQTYLVLRMQTHDVLCLHGSPHGALSGSCWLTSCRAGCSRCCVDGLRGVRSVSASKNWEMEEVASEFESRVVLQSKPLPV